MSTEPLISGPTFEQHPDGLGIGTSSPRISWRFNSPGPEIQNWNQAAYELEIKRENNSKSELYRLDSSQSVLVPWPSTPLSSREPASVRVRAFRDYSNSAPTEWSPWSNVEAALLDRKDWTAYMITTSAKLVADGPLRPLRFRKNFLLRREEEKVTKGRLYVTCYGIYEIFINGHRVGNHCMAPGWTSYHHRLNYQVFDVKDLLQDGVNVIAVEVAEGWYATRLAWGAGKRYVYGKDLAILSQLEISFENSKSTLIVNSDDTWKSAASAILTSEIYDGEKYDMREEKVRWNNEVNFDTSNWANTRALDFPMAKMVAPDSPPVRIIEEIEPTEIFKSPSGKILLDFGQNLVGKLKIRSLTKPNGHVVSFHHAEVLENGELSIRPLRAAKSVDSITFSGEELKNWMPKYTFHGFRYVQIDGWSPTDSTSPLSKSDITAVVMHTDLIRTGWFSCSNNMVNKLHENALWSMKGNFLSIPTDCPQRDERLGWTGDIQVFSSSASFLYNVAGMLGNWLEDVAVEQAAENCIPPVVVPNVLQGIWPSAAQAVWDDVVILTPWALYRASGDTAILERQYTSMQSWLDVGIPRGFDGLWDPDQWQLGDWLDPAAPPSDPGLARTDGTLVADAYLVHITSIMSQICTILNYVEDARRYSADWVRLKRIFQTKYIAPSGLVVGDTQTALALSIVFSLHETNEQRAFAADRLTRLIRYNKFKAGCGFAGTPLITHALSSTGHDQVAYRMLLEKECPSWLYPVTMGATTIWERWDSIMPDGSVNPGQMTSFNHYALGSIVNWLHEVVGGISPLEPGWKKFKVCPKPGGSLTSAEVAYESAYGRIECSWQRDGNKFELSLLVPPNTTALVILPATTQKVGMQSSEENLIGSGRHNFSINFTPAKWPPKALLTEFRVDDGEEDI